MMEYAKDALLTEHPWEKWLYKPKGFDNWIPCEANPRWTVDWDYKRKNDDEMVR
jgi:hypothetical protein